MLAERQFGVRLFIKERTDRCAADGGTAAPFDQGRDGMERDAWAPAEGRKSTGAFGVITGLRRSLVSEVVASALAIGALCATRSSSRANIELGPRGSRARTRALCASAAVFRPGRVGNANTELCLVEQDAGGTGNRFAEPPPRGPASRASCQGGAYGLIRKCSAVLPGDRAGLARNPLARPGMASRAV